MKKVVHIGSRIFCKIKLSGGKLSISGVDRPWKNGNCGGSCGQIVDDIISRLQSIELDEDWTMGLLVEFVSIWKRWHLNDMRAGCEHQRSLGWQDIRIDPAELPNVSVNRDERGLMAIWVRPEEHPKGVLTKPCPVCGYKYGTDWLKEELPEAVITFLESLPETKLEYAWV